MKTTIPLLLIVFIHSVVHAQRIEKYEGDIEINKEQKTLYAKWKITFSSIADKDSLKLFVHESAQIDQITSNNQNLDFKITDEKLIGEDKAISIPVKQISLNTLELNYTTDLNAVKNPNFKFNPDWIELNIYSAWFPFNIAYGTFDYEVNIAAEGKIIGTAIFDNTAKSISKTFDIPLVISDAIEEEKVSNSKIVLYHQGISDSILNRIKSKSEKFYSSYNALFGATETKDLSISINNFNRTIVYARPQFISLSIKDSFTKSNDKTLAHEIAHLWWNKADVGTWEDWLNESFAEYSALLTYRKEFGKEEFLVKIDELSERVKNVKPIWKINKLDSNSNTILTYKGAYLLYTLAHKIGEESILLLMKKTHQLKIRTTLNFLELMQKEFGESTRQWFESQLKK